MRDGERRLPGNLVFSLSRVSGAPRSLRACLQSLNNTKQKRLLCRLSQNRPAGPIILKVKCQLFLDILPITLYCRALYYSRINWSGWIVLIKSGTLLLTGQVLSATSDKWKALEVFCRRSTSAETGQLVHSYLSAQNLWFEIHILPDAFRFLLCFYRLQTKLNS